MDVQTACRRRADPATPAHRKPLAETTGDQSARLSPEVGAQAPPTPPVAIPLPPLATATATPTAPGIELPPTSTPLAGGDANGVLPPGAGMAAINANFIAQAFLAGVRLTVVCFLLLAAYASIRAMLRLR